MRNSRYLQNTYHVLEGWTILPIFLFATLRAKNPDELILTARALMFTKRVRRRWKTVHVAMFSRKIASDDCRCRRRTNKKGEQTRVGWATMKSKDGRTENGAGGGKSWRCTYFIQACTMPINSRWSPLTSRELSGRKRSFRWLMNASAMLATRHAASLRVMTKNRCDVCGAGIQESIYPKKGLTYLWPAVPTAIYTIIK